MIDNFGTVQGGSGGQSDSYMNSVLTVKDGSRIVAKLNFTGSSNSFSLMSDMHGGTLITFN